MKKRFLFLIAGVLMLAGNAFARPVDANKARTVAETYLRAMGMKNVSALQDITAQTPYTEFYIFAAEEGGFILVSADDCARPVLGYSTTSKFVAKDIPENVRGWLEDYEREIRHGKRLEARRGNLGVAGATNPVATQWMLLTNGQMPPQPLTTAVAPLMTTTWGQQPLYNNLCPYDTLADARTVTGCVATATAQIMKYHNHPATGYGSHSYHAYNDSVDHGILSANFGATTYQWSTMPNALTSASSTAEVNAVATLMYHVGVADEMNYDIGRRGGSGAFNYNSNGNLGASSQSSLMAYFKYRPDMTVLVRGEFTDADYCSRLRAELDQQRPILYSGRDYAGGHSFVLHGYDNNGLFYVNWGWRGSYDGYFAIGALNPGEGGDGGNATYTFNESNVALIGIRPNTSWSTTGTTTVTATLAAAAGASSVSGSGSYAFGDTISLVGYADEGYRFVSWNDGNHSNPRELFANGGSYSFTGSIVALQGDTLGYCDKLCSYRTRFSVNGDDDRWGIRLPASVLPVGHSLTSAELYVAEAGTYTLNVYTGTSTATTLVASSQPIYFDNDDIQQWYTFALNTPLTVDGTQNVWITFTCPDANWPATVTNWCGNQDGFCFGNEMYNYSNPFSFMIRGIFSNPVVTAGDTVSYCGNEPYATGIGTSTGSDLYWGIMMPSANMAGYNYLKSVMLYVQPQYAGSYTLNIYTGGETAPGTLALTRTMTFGTADTGWQEIMLPTTFPLPSQNLWITFNTTGFTYPMSACAYTGAANSDWLSLDGTSWSHATDYNLNNSWMIKAVLSNTVPPQDTTTYTITVLSNGLSPYGTVSGGGSFHYGDTTYIMAISGGSSTTGYGAQFLRWNDGNTSAIRRIIVNGNATYVAIFEPTGGCPSISEFPYQWGFEGTLGCWTAIDGNSDNSTWRAVESSGMMHSGIGAAASVSWTNGSAVNASEYLVSPQISIPASHSATLSWWFRVDGNYPEDKLALKVSTTGNTAADFTTTLFDITPTAANGSWTQQTVDLSSYAGQTIYLCFHHHDSYDADYLLIDDVEITVQPVQAPQTYTVTAISADTTMGTVTGGGTYEENAVVTLVATPYSGYHFVQWNDGITTSSRTVTVTANATYIAYFEADSPNPPTGDTCAITTFPYVMDFENGAPCWSLRDNNQNDTTWSLIDNYGYNGSTCAYAFYQAQADDWLMSPRVAVAGNYTVSWKSRVMQSNYPETYQVWAMGNDTSLMIYSETLTDTNYVDRLATFSVPVGDSVLIMWRYISADKYVLFLDNVTISQGATQYTVTAQSNNPAWGTVTGGGTYNAGTSVTLTATPATGYHFVQWNDGNNQNPRTIVVTDNVSYTATFASDASCVVNTFPWSYGFENATECWTLFVADSGSYGFLFSNADSYAHGGTYSLFGTYSDDYNVDQWAVSPAIVLPANATGIDLSYYVYTTAWAGIRNSYEVRLSTTGTNPSDFSVLLYSETDSARAYVQRTVSLAAYAGQTIRLAFRNITPMGGDAMMFDDINIGITTAPGQYTLTVLSNNNAWGTVSGGGIYTAGSNVTLNATPNSGYHFVAWSDGSTVNPRTVTVNADATYTAIFEANPVTQYTVTVLSNNLDWGTVSGGGTFDEGSSITISATPADGYRFVHWSDGDTNAIRTVTVNANVTYVATFEAIVIPHYTVNVSANVPAWGTVSGGGDYEVGTQVTISAIANPGCRFLRWHDNDTNASRTFTVTANVTYVAIFDTIVIPHYTLTVLANNSAWGTVSGGGDYEEGTTVTLTASSNSGYHFVQWQDGITDSIRTVTVTTNASYTATFAQNGTEVTFYTVSVYSNNPSWGTVSGSGSYAENTSAVLTATANPGYHFVEWNDGDTNAVRTVTVTANASYIATFEVDAVVTYTLNVVSNNAAWGTVTGSGTYEQGTIAVLTATANPGYHFVEWNDGDTNAVRTVTVTANANYIATFAADVAVTYTLTVLANNSAWGTVTGGGTYEQGATAVLTATANPGYHFVEWNDGNANAVRTITVTSDATFTATFEADAVTRYTITVLSTNESKGTVSGGGTYEEGAEVTITAIPNEGYRFVQWNDGDTNAVRTITVTADATYIATFDDKIGIDEVLLADVSLYPNPATSYVVVSGIESQASLTLVDAAGRLVAAWTASSDRMTLDISQLPAGQYFLRIALQGAVSVKKLMVK